MDIQFQEVLNVVKALDVVETITKKQPAFTFAEMISNDKKRKAVLEAIRNELRGERIMCLTEKFPLKGLIERD